MIKTLQVQWLLAILTVTQALALDITSVAPARGIPDTSVHLTGGVFSRQAKVYLGEHPVTPMQVSPRKMDFKVPALPPGLYSLTVRDDSDTTPAPFSFEVLAPAPVIKRLTPDNLDFCADEAKRQIQVEGENFQKDALVILGGNAVNSQWNNSASMEFDLPDLPAGVYGAEVRNPDGSSSLPHSLWINSVPEITGIERGGDFVNHYEVIVRGKNFFPNSILVVTEPDASAGGSGTLQVSYYAHRAVSSSESFNNSSPSGKLRYIDCQTLVYLRYPLDFQDKELSFRVINPDGKKTGLYTTALP